MQRNRLALFLGILSSKQQTHIELIGHLEAELLNKEWPITVFYCANGMFVTIAPLEN